MSPKTQNETVVKQLNEIFEELQATDLPDAEANSLLIRAQGLMDKYNQVFQAQSKKMKELQQLMQSQINTMR